MVLFSRYNAKLYFVHLFVLVYIFSAELTVVIEQGSRDVAVHSWHLNP